MFSGATVSTQVIFSMSTEPFLLPRRCKRQPRLKWSPRGNLESKSNPSPCPTTPWGACWQGTASDSGMAQPLWLQTHPPLKVILVVGQLALCQQEQALLEVEGRCFLLLLRALQEDALQDDTGHVNALVSPVLGSPGCCGQDNADTALAQPKTCWSSLRCTLSLALRADGGAGIPQSREKPAAEG